MIEIKAPNRLASDPLVSGRPLTVFLAGSIEMGGAEPWQAMLVERCKDLNIIFLNPRRTDWDSSWEQSANNKPFREQVEWELNGLENVDATVMYFQAGTMSPITLLELGLCCTRPSAGRHLFVWCQEGFWRKGNVDITCDRYHVQHFSPATTKEFVTGAWSLLKGLTTWGLPRLP